MTTYEIKALALIYDLTQTGTLHGPQGEVLQARNLSQLNSKAHEILETFKLSQTHLSEAAIKAMELARER